MTYLSKLFSRLAPTAVASTWVCSSPCHCGVAVCISAVSYFTGGALEAASAVPNMSVDMVVCSPLFFHQGAYGTIPICMLQMRAV